MTSWREKVRNLEEINERLRDDNHCLKRHVKKLENLLRQVLNENTPSSKLPEWEKKSPDRIDEPKNPRGKPIGSEGATRKIPKPDTTKTVRLNKAAEKKYGLPIGFVKKTIGDISELPKMSWTEFRLAKYIDPKTGKIIIAQHPDCPKIGIFGPNIKSMITILREKVNISEGQTIKLLNSFFSCGDLSPATIEAELQRVSNILSEDYDKIKKVISESPVKHSDETGQSVNGKNWCMYGMSTNTHTFYFAKSKKRKNHIIEKLSNPFENVLVCDGHSIYDWYPTTQRCWSHGIRKEKWLLDEEQTQERVALDNTISGTFSECQSILDKSPPSPNNIWDVMCMRNRIQQSINYKWKDEKCQKVINYYENGFDNWFLFMLVDDVPPTNNLCERDIRKHVMKRKNTGAFRSEAGIKNHCVILSLFETWKKQDKDPFKKLKDKIRIYNMQPPAA